MSVADRGLALRLRIGLARLEQRVGWAGLAGGVLMAASAVGIAAGWGARTPPETLAAGAALARTLPATPTPVVADRLPTLPPAADVPLLLMRIQRSAVEQGLGWPRADYRITAATDETPASLEVRCVLKGPYPNLRRFVGAVLRDMPTLTLREFMLSRPNGDVPDVEAKLGLVIYLGTSPTAPGAKVHEAVSHAEAR